MANNKPLRIRDPLHNLIEFDRTEHIERMLWDVIQTPPFQRLRRVKQLGFSDFVYPGATHSRFSHSIGVFHTARRLVKRLERQLEETNEHQRHVALAASLVHDVGHGMFSHAFEAVGKELKLKMADHEHVSELLINNSEISEIFCDERRGFGSGFATDVAAVIKRGKPGNSYQAVVSSQFDADRLDYMQRDRMMSGIQNSGIDFTWLMANLEIGKVPTGTDELQTGEVDTLVLGPKAHHAAETYVIALFQLYPTLYFHKTTRAAEKVFTFLMVRLIELIRNGNIEKTGLSDTHPISRFAIDSDKIENVLSLDDAVFWGALPMLAGASDPCVSTLSRRLWERKLPKCIDIREELVSDLNYSPNLLKKDHDFLLKTIDKACVQVNEILKEWSKEKSNSEPRILTDIGYRSCYSNYQDSKGPLNQIRIQKGDSISDIVESSALIRGQETFHFFRAYYDEADTEAKRMIQSTKAKILEGDRDAD